MSTCISSIQISNGTTYELKDALARAAIDDLIRKMNIIYNSLSGAFSTYEDFKDVKMVDVLSALYTIASSPDQQQ